MNKRGWFDHDCDGIPDNLDPDDDNDGYFDSKQVSFNETHGLHAFLYASVITEKNCVLVYTYSRPSEFM